MFWVLVKKEEEPKKQNQPKSVHKRDKSQQKY